MEINDIQDRLIDEFNHCEDWTDKYEMLIAYGIGWSAMEEKFRTDDNAIKGCQSRLWIATEIQDGRMVFYADSDSKIVRGMVAIVLEVLNNQTPEKVAKADLYFLEAIGLSTHLSPVRTNGLATIVKRIYQLAGNYVTHEAD